MIRKSLILFSVLSLLVVRREAVLAGEYHNQTVRQKSGSVTLACSQCHTMHASQGNFSLIYNGIGIYPKLIRATSVVELCRYCHDGDPESLGAPDLFAAPYNASSGDFSTGGTYDNEKRHDIGLDLTGILPPGYAGTAWTTAQQRYGTVFSCIYCHDQHGNENHRNLRPLPLDPSSRKPVGTAQGGVKVTHDNGSYQGAAIFQKVVDGSGNGSDPANQFSTDNMVYRKSQDQIQGFCGQCHSKFYEAAGWGTEIGGSPNGDSGTGTAWKRHPVGGISIGVGNGHTDPTHFNSIPAAQRVRHINPDGQDGGADEQPFCFTCHRVHGSTNHSNLIFGGATSAGGAGSMMRDTCQQCHNQ